MKTAVEWLVEQIEQRLLTFGSVPPNVMYNLKEQAKEMEKQQIIDAHTSGQSLICKQAADLYEHGIEIDDSEGVEIRDAEQYYKETFKTDKG